MNRLRKLGHRSDWLVSDCPKIEVPPVPEIKHELDGPIQGCLLACGHDFFKWISIRLADEGLNVSANNSHCSFF